MVQRVRYRFSGFEFDPATGEVTSPSEVRRLAPQPALVLTLLLEADGKLVERQTLIEALWSDTVVEYDKGLNFCVREVRAALGDTAADPRYIETLPRRGYRFLASTEAVGVGSGDPAPDEAAARHRGTAARFRVALTAAGLVGLFLAGSVWIGEASAPDSEARESAEFGGYLLTRGEPQDLERSIGYFRDAITLDPNYARAYSGLGSAYLKLSRVQEARFALGRSLELDPTQWAPHLTLALHSLYSEYDRESAARHFEAAFQRGPDQVVVRHTRAWYLALSEQMEAAIEEMQEALRLDPVSPRVNGDVGRLYRLAGRHEEALAHCRRTAELDPDLLRPRDCVVQTLAAKGAIDEAAVEALRILAQFDPQGDAVPTLNGYWRWAGRELARQAGTGSGSHVYAAAAWLRAGEEGEALNELRRAETVHCHVLPQIAIDPVFDPLRDNPDFQELLRRIEGPSSTASDLASHREHELEPVEEQTGIATEISP